MYHQEARFYQLVTKRLLSQEDEVDYPSLDWLEGEARSPR